MKNYTTKPTGTGWKPGKVAGSYFRHHHFFGPLVAENGIIRSLRYKFSVPSTGDWLTAALAALPAKRVEFSARAGGVNFEGVIELPLGVDDSSIIWHRDGAFTGWFRSGAVTAEKPTHAVKSCGVNPDGMSMLSYGPA